MNAYTTVFADLAHLGPGDPGITRNLAQRLHAELPAALRVADFGCGVGASALVLAQSLPGARILAVDAHQPFIERLETAANTGGLGDRICAVTGDMSEPPALDGVIGEFDLIWSESAIYSIGRTVAFTTWRRLLRPGGWLVFSDVVWRSEPDGRSGEAAAFWAGEYPDISTARDVVAELTAAGFAALDPVLTGRTPWANYYEPLRGRLRQLARRLDLPPALSGLTEELEREIAVFDSAGDEVALAYFLARRNPNSQ
jgi:SAM-dependent methyltransferase